MIDKGSAGSYNHSHKKSVKSLAKALDIKQRIGQNSQRRSKDQLLKLCPKTARQ